MICFFLSELAKKSKIDDPAFWKIGKEKCEQESWNANSEDKKQEDGIGKIEMCKMLVEIGRMLLSMGR